MAEVLKSKLIRKERLRVKALAIILTAVVVSLFTSSATAGKAPPERVKEPKVTLDLLALNLSGTVTKDDIKTFKQRLYSLFGEKIQFVRFDEKKNTLNVGLFSTVSTRDVLRIASNCGLRVKSHSRKILGEERM